MLEDLQYNRGIFEIQAIVFKPNKKMKASPRICLCKNVKMTTTDHVSSLKQNQYQAALKEICLRSSITEKICAEIQDSEDAIDTPVPDALLKDADKRAHETFYFMKLIQGVGRGVGRERRNRCIGEW